LSGVVSEIV